ncbi:MAG: glycoside hydrolase family 127 protein [Acidobacteriia bacterium]|nr:glycoside hydrolase family 127 protein [Terriglobia bacterium]
MSDKLSRREALRAGALFAAGARAALGQERANRAGRSPSEVLRQFAYNQVQLAPGPLQRQFEENHSLFLNLSEDAMLKPFRQRAGMPAPGEDMGGWYDNFAGFDPKGDFHGFIPGHSFGQYLSALARCYAVTGDRETQAKVNRLVKAYGQTVSPKFYVDYHLPAYTYDKTVCGLIDAHVFAHDPTAAAVLKSATDAVLPFLPEKALTRPEQAARPHKDIAYTWDETYTLPENQFLAFDRIGEPRYRELAVRFLLNAEYFDPLARNENVLPGKHAYSHVNAFSSACQAYLHLKDEKYLRAAQNGLRMVHEQSYATGGWGPDEAFVEPGNGKLAESLTTPNTFETPCGAYGEFKATRYLLRITRDSRYGDAMERMMYNTVLGARPIQPDGTSFYYSDYHPGGQKVWYKDKWPCCSGTLPQLAADYRISAYLQGRDGVYVNLYAPSTLEWVQDKIRCSLRQSSEYPYDSRIRLDVTAARPAPFTLHLRIPEWADGAALWVNGRRGLVEAAPGTFAEVRREWKTGDRIELEIPLPMRLQPIDAQNPDQVALLRGPLVLFALGGEAPAFERSALLAAQRKSPGSRVWTVGEVEFTPFPEIQAERYSTYVKVG